MNLDKVLKDHPSLVYSDSLKEICKPLEKLRITYFSYVQIDENGKFSALGLEPGFVRTYFEKEYYRFDIHMAQSRMTEQYIIWDTIERVKESNELSQDFYSFSLGHTFTILQQNDKKKDYFHFAGKLGDTSINDSYLRNLDLLKKFILYFKNKVSTHKELKQGFEIRFEIPKEDSGFFVSTESNEPVFEFNKSTPLDRFYLSIDQYITQREAECLHWLFLGKTIDQIALILNIAPRTVKAHIKNIKVKFNCQNQFQLGALYSQLAAIFSNK